MFCHKCLNQYEPTLINNRPKKTCSSCLEKSKEYSKRNKCIHNRIKYACVRCKINNETIKKEVE